MNNPLKRLSNRAFQNSPHSISTLPEKDRRKTRRCKNSVLTWQNEKLHKQYESEDQVLFVFLFWNPTGDLRYLVERRGRQGLKFTSASVGAVCLSRGTCALHTEPATAYALLARMPPARACRLRLLSVIPQTVLAVPAPRGSPNVEPLKVAGRWIHETGLQYREASTWRAPRPACTTDGSRRAASLGDVAPLLSALALSYVIAVLIVIGECLVRAVHDSNRVIFIN